MSAMSLNEVSQHQRNNYQKKFQTIPRYAINPNYTPPFPRLGIFNKYRPRINAHRYDNKQRWCEYSPNGQFNRPLNQMRYPPYRQCTPYTVRSGFAHCSPCNRFDHPIPQCRLRTTQQRRPPPLPYSQAPNNYSQPPIKTSVNQMTQQTQMPPCSLPYDATLNQKTREATDSRFLS